MASQQEMLYEEREKMHRQMLSSVSHDLKTPLASIIGSLEIHERLRKTLSEEKKNILIHTALQEAYRLDNFITNILDMAKLEGGMVKTRMEETDMTGLVQDAITKLGQRLQTADVKLMTHAPMHVRTDQALLTRALGLILDNAVRYAGEHPSIRIEFGQENGRHYLRVRDNGPGIPDGQQEAIFCKYTRFARQDHQNAGTGLGLSIARAIAQLLGGNVVAERNNNGAVFLLTFTAGA